jgi:hypothetical protein
MARPATDRIPDVAGTVEGWRVWGVPLSGYWHDPPYGPIEDPALRSVLRNVVWPQHTMVAQCPMCPDEDVPGTDCLCGLYSARSLAHLATMRPYLTAAEVLGMVPVLGQVANWGRVQQGPDGWRAAKLADSYGVPVRVADIHEMLDPPVVDLDLVEMVALVLAERVSAIWDRLTSEGAQT